ncbi:ABC transporter permease [Propionimicrobium sp. PCR01-08-3]|uniref:ABC transporter permease n=1 Tax=Propionimicrobium sp. PCR01-08-3 TaxID=3052086 RepID=UPI00255C4F4A|nr:ABC transporter permease [Propionimicrobium sp. PCR01-08-3]WIY82638.1 ABC transporter permease [Propionimicrobium sp. PCR01-08-3]
MGKTNVRVSQPPLKQWNLIRAFGNRDLKSKFKGTALGWVWSLVVPLASLGIYTVIFGGLFQMEPPGIASRHEGVGIFAIWLFAGLTVWSFFQNSVNAGISGLLGAGGLLQKVYFPAYSPVLGACLAVGVQSAIEMGILLAALLVLGNVGWTWLLVPLLLVLLMIFTASISVMLAVWNVHVRDLAHLVGVFLQLMFYATPIIYNPEIVPEVVFGLPARRLVTSMPVAEFIGLFRSLLYELNPGSIVSWLAACGWALLAVLGAIWVCRRWGSDLGERI